MPRKMSLCIIVVSILSSIGAREILSISESGFRGCCAPGVSGRISSSMICPQFCMKTGMFDFYFGINATGTSDTLWATAEKYRMGATELFLSEIDSYSIDLKLFLIQPEIGARIDLMQRQQIVPFLDIGLFLLIPIIDESYEEKFLHFDSTGALIYEVYNNSSGKPRLSASDLYEFGLHAGFGAKYEISGNFSIFIELGTRTLLGGGDIKYNYFRESQTYLSLNEEHYWNGGGSLSTFSMDGYIGAKISW